MARELNCEIGDRTDEENARVIAEQALKADNGDAILSAGKLSRYARIHAAAAQLIANKVLTESTSLTGEDKHDMAAVVATGGAMIAAHDAEHKRFYHS